MMRKNFKSFGALLNTPPFWVSHHNSQNNQILKKKLQIINKHHPGTITYLLRYLM